MPRICFSKEKLRVVEGGACNFYDIFLDGPLSCPDVMVQIEDPTNQTRVTPKVVRFTQENAEIPQKIRVIAIDDDYVEKGEEETLSSLNHQAVNGQISPTNLPVEVVDNDGGLLFTFGEIGDHWAANAFQHSFRAERRLSISVEMRKVTRTRSNSFSKRQNHRSGRRVRFNSVQLTRNSPSKRIPEENIRQIASGGSHLLCVLADGRLLSFGNGADGQLLHGDLQSRKTLHQWKAVDRDGVLRSKVTSAACGEAHTAIVTDDGKLLLSGSNAHHQLGICEGPDANCPWCLGKKRKMSEIDCHEATLNLSQAADPKRNLTVPRMCESLSKLFVEKVSCGLSHSVALVSTGSSLTDRGVTRCRILGWGDARNGALGCGFRNIVPHPVELRDFENMDPFQISCGSRHTAVLCGEGTIHVSGWGIRGCIGRRVGEDSDRRHHFERIGFHSEVFVDVSSGSGHLAALSDAGEVFACGSNLNGELGLGDNFDRTFLTKVDFFTDLGVASIACGMFHTCAMTHDGLLFVWGSNNALQLGLGDQVLNETVPVLHPLSFKGEIKQVQAGNCHTAILVSKSTMDSIERMRVIAKIKRQTCEFWELKRKRDQIELIKKRTKQKREARAAEQTRRIEKPVDQLRKEVQARFAKLPFRTIGTPFMPRLHKPMHHVGRPAGKQPTRPNPRQFERSLTKNGKR